MPLPTPTLDARSYSEILQEALGRVPVHTPEWTNFNDSDPGVTLLQLFAFMAESLLYRANLIPERNRQKFLRLLGIPLRPASPAQGVAAIANERGLPATVTLPAGLALAAGKIGFVTMNALDVLPLEARVFYRRSLLGAERTRAEQIYQQLYAVEVEDPATLEYYETTPFDPSAGVPLKLSQQTVDGAIWIALLLREPDVALRAQLTQDVAGKTLTLGLMPTLAGAAQVLPAGGPRPAQAGPPLVYELSTGTTQGGGPSYTRLDARADADASQDLTLVQLTLPADPASIGLWTDLDPLEEGVGDYPPALDDAALQARVLAWLRIRLSQPPTTGTAPAWDLAYDWLGINAARIAQRVEVSAERLGSGTGEPDQSYTLVNTPVIPETVALTVGGESWTRIDDLLAAAPEVPPRGAPASAPEAAHVYTVDRESGEVRFGDGAHGARPPAGSVILAAYAYGGGAAGNVGAGAVKTAPALPPGFKVANPVPTWGGTEGETVEEGERTIPLYLRHRDRAVSAEDFAAIVGETPGIALGRVEIKPLYQPGGNATAPGVVTVLVVPVDVAHPEGPVPDDHFLKAVCSYLEPRRLLTTEVHVSGPEYQSLSVSVGFDAVPGRDIAAVREAIKAALRDFLSPTTGGQDGAGWPLDKAVEDRELWARAARVAGVASVRDVRMWDASATEIQTLPISGLQLPRLDRVSASFGDAEDLTAGAPAATDSTGKPVKRKPVPTLPPSC